MADYKEMYLTLCRACEQAERILIEAQQKCEEIYLEDEESPLELLKQKEK